MTLKFIVALACASSLFPALAQSSTYNCNFQKDGTELNKCKIDSASANSASCTFKFSDNLSGLCGVGSSNGADILLCAIFTPAAATANVMSGIPTASAAAAAKALAQKPGFVAGGLTAAQTGKAVVVGLYVEKQGAPTLAGACTP